VLTPEMLGRTFAGAPDPELARVAFSRVGDDTVAREALARPEVTEVAARLLGFSTAASDFLVAHADEVMSLADVSARDGGALRAELASDVDRLGPAAGLRRFRQRAMLRVAARDLGGAALEEVVAEISAIADACLAEALDRIDDPGLAVIGLGKLGGSELNYASDVDLLFLHRETGPEAQEAAEHAVAALTALLAEPTAEGLALRVDVALRPGGRAGALSRSLEAALVYYDRESATWERQAMIKARPVAGDAQLGSAFIDGVEPYVYPPELAPAAIEDVRRTKVRLEEYIRQRGKELTEVKRGRGGIRDVEFAVQLLQIVHGRRDARLRTPNTLAALRALAREGYVADTDAEALAEAYRSSTGCRSCATCRPTTCRRAGTRARRSRVPSTWPTPTSSPRSTSAPPGWSARSTSACSTGRCWNRSPARPSRTRATAPTGPRPRSSSVDSGSPTQPVPTTCSGASSTRAAASARCSPTSSR
jgi:glutamate-ammonia-ligase adenylyltransferase